MSRCSGNYSGSCTIVLVTKGDAPLKYLLLLDYLTYALRNTYHNSAIGCYLTTEH